MKRLLSLLVLVILTVITALAFAADPVAAAVTTQPVTFMAWFSSNENALLKFALATSEFLGIFTVFKGNGILDSIVKGLKALSEIQTGTPSNATPAETKKSEAGFIRLPVLFFLLLSFAAIIAMTGCAGTTAARIDSGLQVADDVTDIAMSLCKDGTLPAESCTAIAAGNLAINIIEQLIDPHVEWVE